MSLIGGGDFFFFFLWERETNLIFDWESLKSAMKSEYVTKSNYSIKFHIFNMTYYLSFPSIGILFANVNVCSIVTVWYLICWVQLIDNI